MYTASSIVTPVLFFVIGMCVFGLLLILGCVFLGIAIYNHAKARGDQNAVLWGILSGFFVPIGAIIYAVIAATTKKPQRICMSCGVPVPDYAPTCQNCGAQMPVMPEQLLPQDAPQRNKRFKGMLIAAIVSIAVSIVVVIVSTVFFTISMVEYGVDQYDGYSYSDQYHHNGGNNSFFPDL